MRIAVLTLSCLVTLGGVLPPAWAETTAPASPAPVINVRTGVHPDFDRVVFDWPRNVTYKIQRDGDHATVIFSADAQTRFGSDANLLTRAHGFASNDQDGHLVVSFSINPRATLKDFISDKSIVIDIQGGAAPATTKLASNATPPLEEPTPAVAPTTSALTIATTTNTAPTLLTPAQKPPKPTDVPAIDVTPTAPTSLTTSPAASATLPVNKAAPAASTPLPASTNKKLQTVAATDITDTPLLIASLDPHTATRAAIYLRAGYGYIVFDRKLTLAADAMSAGQQAARVQLEPLELPKASGFRFSVPIDVAMHASRTGTVWQIFLSKQEPDVPVSTSLVAQPDFALGARFLLPLSDAPEPVHLTDPVVGDDLIVVPLEQTEAFSVTRRLADFQIIPAAQGLVIKPLTDKIIVRSVTDGMEITAEGGLRLSTAIDTGASQQSSQKARAAASGKSMFDFSAWRGKPEESFTQTRQRLQQTIVDVPEAERNRARLELARFYFAHGYGEEAAALLTYLAKQVPDLMAHADFLAIMGASQIIAYHAEEGLKNLDTALLSNQPEIELWQAVAQAELRNWTAAEEKFSVTETMLGGYPEPFYSRFSVLAVESALATNKDREAADWIDRLENGPHTENIAPAIAYLHGVMHAKSGRAIAAEQDWKEAENSNDRLYKIRAELALIDLGVSTRSLTAAQAADRLEALRFGWRGDDLEVDILHRLGQFYVEAKNVKAGLNVLSRAVQLYPSSPLVPQIQSEMSVIFHDVFLGDLGKNLSPLDALTLYQQYRNLMPPGKEGIAVTRNLAERLVAIDLLDQAAELLEDLVKNKLQGEDKARTAVRLAGIRLLDHKPEAAMAALDYDNNEPLSQDITNERLLLRAKSLSDLHRDDEALGLIQDNPRESAKILKADITMHAQHWSEAAKTLRNLVGDPPKPGETLQRDQVEWLVNCAIALSLAGDQAGLDKLAIDFGAAMAGTPDNDTFRILTQPDKVTQSRDITSAQSRIADVDMFQGFLNNYRKSENDAAKAIKP